MSYENLYANPSISRATFSAGQPFITQIIDKDGELVQLEWNMGEIIVTTWNTRIAGGISSPNIPAKILTDEINYLVELGRIDEDARNE